MAKNKKGRAAKGARYRTTTAGPSRPRNQPQDIAASFIPKATAAHGFSLTDEARNTAKRSTATGQDGKLRVRPVAFVSAGMVEPLKELDDVALSDNGQDFGLEGAIEEPPRDIFSLLPERVSKLQSDRASPIGEDVQAPETQVASNPGLSDEQQPFFVDTTGDQRLSRPSAQPAHVPHLPPSDDETDSSEEVVLFKGRNCAYKNETSEPAVDNIVIEVETVKETFGQISLGTTDGAGCHSSSPPSPKPWQLRGYDDEAAIVADYLANMANDDDEDDDEEYGSGAGDGNTRSQPSWVNRDLGGSDGEVVIAEEPGSDESTGKEKDNSGSDSSEIPETGDASDIDDEALARLLAKQEELGLDGDELVLFSAERYEESLIRTKRPTSGKENLALNQNQMGKNGRGAISSASAVADAFDELDLMDWDRHNPPRKPKGQRGQPAFDISDSETEATLQSTWQKDRLRKKDRKREREELRAQGLLGKHADPSDPRVKYLTGMSLNQIKEEMRDFLCGSEHSLTLPPMDSNARKVIHELANKLNIKSKSAGHGDQRRPALYRTLRTVRYSEADFERVFARIGRKYFPRLDVKGKAPKRGGTGGGGGGRSVSHAAFTYKDGEVVGASAPELGQENKGRAMLEKMGWTTGMALGAMHNKGILQPVAHVVKRTKAGLG